jgi:Proteasome subunit A N-terminal signature
MFRNQYDTDVTVWSPEGRLLQVRFRFSSHIKCKDGMKNSFSIYQNLRVS